MEVLQTRLDSFKKSKRVKNPNKPSSSKTLKWPHTSAFKATPETLAEAGFYYNPSYEDPDNVICFVCEKELGGWEPDDDPYDIHWSKCGQECCWANLRCGIRQDLDRKGRFISQDKNRLPTSKAMEKMRLETFSLGGGWVHDKVKNHGAGSKIMARSGFVYLPETAGDDSATCLYCGASLRSWAAEDDPLYEHRQRGVRNGVTCPFFSLGTETAPTKPPSKAQASKPASKAQSKPSSRTTSRANHNDMEVPTKTEDGSGEDDGDASEEEEEAKATAKSSRKSRATTTRKSTAKRTQSKARSASRSTLQEVEEVEEHAAAPVAPAKKKSRSRSKSVAQQAKPEANDDVELPPTTKKKSRATAKALATPDVVVSDDGDEIVEQQKKPSRSKSKQSVLDAAPPQKSRTKTSASYGEAVEEKPTKSRKKQKESEVETTEGEAKPIVRSSRTARTTAKSKPKQASSVVAAQTLSDAPGRKPSKDDHIAKTIDEPLSDADIEMVDDTQPPDAPSPQPEPSAHHAPEPKRKASTASSDADQRDSERRSSHASKGKNKQSSLPVSGDGLDSAEEEQDVFLSSENPAPFPPASAPILPPVSPSSKSKPTKPPSNPKPAPTKVSMTKVVDISDEDEPPREVRRSSKSSKQQVASQEASEAPRSHSRLDGDDAHSSTQSRPNSRMSTKSPSLPVESDPVDSDVQMEAGEDEVEVRPVPVPSTPPRSAAQKMDGGPAKEVEAEDKVEQDPPDIPPLSRLPFTPLQSLTEAELDMTVEEWIRYQMDVEFDKFRRDGDRELQRFRKKAEEVRQVIEGL